MVNLLSDRWGVSTAEITSMAACNDASSSTAYIFHCRHTLFANRRTVVLVERASK